MLLKIAATVWGMLLLSLGATAQPFTFDKKVKPKEIPVFSVNKTDKTKGKMGIAQIVQVKDTAYYFCKGMGIYNPMLVRVVAKDKTKPLKVRLHKWNWKQVSREGPTIKGVFTEQFVTEGSFGIMIINTTKQPATYNIYVYMASEAPPKLPSAFKKTNKK